MSYDIAVWEGAPPSDDRAALAEFEQRYERAQDGEAPSRAMRRSSTRYSHATVT